MLVYKGCPAAHFKGGILKQVSRCLYPKGGALK